MCLNLLTEDLVSESTHGGPRVSESTHGGPGV